MKVGIRMKAFTYFRHLSLRIKLILVFLLILLLMSFASLVQMLFFQSYVDQYNKMIDNISVANAINGILKEELDFEIREIAFGKLEFIEGNQYELLATLHTYLDQIEADDKQNRISQELDDVRRTLSTVEEQIDKLGEQIKNNATADERNGTFEYIAITTEIVEEQVQLLIKAKLKVSEETKTTITENINRDTLFYIIALCVVVAISFTLAWFISERIAKPIRLLSKNATSIAEGNLMIEPVFIKTKDEIGELCESFNLMFENLKEIILSVRDTNDRVFQSSESINQGISENLKAGEEVANATMVISETLQAQNKIVNLSASKFHVLFETFNGIQKNTGQIKHHADESLEFANQGNKQIDDFMEQFYGVKVAVNQVYQDTEQLQGLADEMAGILKLIKDIAKETQILSINAAIEASRESHSGRSFSVIAQRVKQLAVQSTMFAVNIEEKMEIVRERITFIHDQMSESVNEIAAGSEKADQAKNVFVSIHSTNANVHSEVENITRDMDEAGESMNQLNDMIKDIESRSDLIKQEIDGIASMSQEQLATLEEVTATSDELVVRIQDMNDSVKKFSV